MIQCGVVVISKRCEDFREEGTQGVNPFRSFGVSRSIRWEDVVDDYLISIGSL